jgi:predicted acetyltransferase
MVEGRIAILVQRGNYQMLDAMLSEKGRQQLWTEESIENTNLLDNITSTTIKKRSAHAMLHNQSSKLVPYLVPFRQIRIVTVCQKFKGKWKEKGIKMILIGYAT